MAGLTLEQLKQMGATPKKSGGLTLDQLKQKAFPPAKKEPNFMERVSEDLSKRQTGMFAGTEAYFHGEQTLPETAIQAVGQGVGFVFDVGGEVLKSIIDKTPEAIKTPIKDIAKSVLNTPLGQSGLKALSTGIDTYNEWKKGNPRMARDLEAVVNIGMIASIGAGVKIGGEVGKIVEKPILEGMGTALKTSGEAVIKNEKQNFVRELIKPIQTKSVKEAQVARTTEEGSGIFKKSVIEPTSQELRAEKYVSDIPEVKKGTTFQQNFNAIQKANQNEAKLLETELSKNDFIYPRKELFSRLEKTKETLAQNPVLTGDAEKTAGKLISEIERRVNASPSKGSELLKVRKEFDRWVESQKGGSAFDPSKENAFSIANREIRRTLNEFLNEKAPSVGVKESLKKQSALYNAMDNIKPKAAQEADTTIRRFLQRSETVLGTKNRVVQILAASVGIGGLGAAATFAPAAAGLGIGSYLLYRGGKLVLSPEIRKGLGDLLIELNKIGKGKVFGSSIGASGIIELKTEIQKLLDEYND